MAANTNPIYTLIGDVQWGTGALINANNAKDGTGTVMTVFSGDATNGGFVQRLRWRAAGTNIATVGRIFINNGQTNATPSNNVLHDEITLTATTLSEIAALANYEVPLNFALPPGYKLNVTIGTTVASGYYVSTIGGKY